MNNVYEQWWYREFVDSSDWVWDQLKGWEDDQGKGLADQTIRAIDSVGANLAEGTGRNTPGQICQFWRYAAGSAHEAIYWLERLLARRLLPIRDALPVKQKLQDALMELEQAIANIKKE